MKTKKTFEKFHRLKLPVISIKRINNCCLNILYTVLDPSPPTKKKKSEKLNHFLLLSQILVKLQQLRHT